MRPWILLALPGLVAAEGPAPGAVSLGSALPGDLKAEHDPPWAGARRCGWQGELLLCADAAGRVDGVYHRHYAPVSGGSRQWLQTAGLEWRSGYRVAQPAPGGQEAWRWGNPRPPYDGWEGLEPARPDPGAAAPRAARVVALEGAEALGPARAGVEAALSRCPGAPLDRLPLAVLYDDSGEARLVRVQAFPPEGADLGCVAAAVGAPARPAGVDQALELMVSLR